MNQLDVLKLNRIFDNLEDEMYIENNVSSDVEEFNKLNEKLISIKNQINQKIEGSKYYFDDKTGLLIERKDFIIGVRKKFMFNDVKRSNVDIFEDIEKIDKQDFDKMTKFLKDDKELISKFINNCYKDFESFKDVERYIKKFCCGICSENNVIFVNQEINNDDEFNIIYRIVVNQVTDGIQDLYGELLFFTTTKEAFTKNKLNYNCNIII